MEMLDEKTPTMATSNYSADVKSETTIAEQLLSDMLWYFVNHESQKEISWRSVRGTLVALWVLICFFTRLFIHVLFLKFLDLLKIHLIIQQAVRSRKVIEFEKLVEYKYAPLYRDREIRVLILHPGHWKDDISCDLKTISLDNPCEYEAVSYAWGDDSEKKNIRCGQSVLEIRQNLYSALRRFRHKSRPQTLWVDALCITLLSLDYF
jgi:hypothetical protein